MQYVLLVFLEFQKYKEPINLQIFANNRLIDDIDLEENISVRKNFWSMQEMNQAFLKYSKECHYEYEYDLPPTTENKHPHVAELVTKDGARLVCPEKLLCYELEGSQLADNFTFRINDSNTNYTNGFMTKSNLIKFKYFCLLPKKLLTRDKLNRLALISKKRRIRKKLPYADHLYAYYKDNELASRKGDDAEPVRWPTARYEDWYGGQKEFTIPLIKKYGILMLDPHRDIRNTPPKKTRVIFESDFLCYADYYGLINIDNENQRSNNERASHSGSHVGR